MKYFDAQKRKKVYLHTSSIRELELNIDAGKYLGVAIEERLGEFTEYFEQLSFEGYNAIKIIVNVSDTDENFLSDDDIFELMSNLTVAYARTFPEPKEKVASPKRKLLEQLPISPMSVVALTMLRVVDKPIQVCVNRDHLESGSHEEVRLIW